MELYVLNNSYQTVGIVDAYTSLIWTKRYFDFGDCELYIKASVESLNILTRGSYLMRNDDDMVCRIEYVELDTDTEEGNYLIVKAYDCRRILSQRIVWKQTNFTGTVENYIRKLVTDAIVNPTITARKISNFQLEAAQGFTERISEQVSCDQLDEKIINTCRTYGYGSRITLDNGIFTFGLYRGTDRSYYQDVNDYVVFSHDFDNIISSKYITDSSNLKNVALVGGEGEGTARKMLAYGGASGLARREIFVDAKGVSTTTESGETVDYNEALKSEAIEALSEHGTIVSFEGEVEPNYSYMYKKDYQLGDIVQVRNEYGIETGARITEVIESFDRDGYTVIPTFENVEVAT